MKTDQDYRDAVEILLGDVISRMTSEPNNIEQAKMLIVALQISIERLTTRWNLQNDITK